VRCSEDFAGKASNLKDEVLIFLLKIVGGLLIKLMSKGSQTFNRTVTKFMKLVSMIQLPD
jgi:hypothetical protein